MSTLAKPYQQPAVSHSEREEKDEVALLLWLCPHTSVTLDQARGMFLYRPPDAEDGYTESLRACDDKFCGLEVSNSVTHSFQGQHALMLETYLTLFRIQGCEDYDEASKRSFTGRHVRLALSHLKFPICRHLRTDDSDVLEHFNPRCIDLRKEDGTYASCTCGNSEYPGSKTKNQHYRPCLGCRKEGGYTAFGFQVCPTSWNGRKDLLLRLKLYRNLGRLNNSHAPGWRCHAYRERESDQIAQHWQLWINSIGQQEVKYGGLSKNLCLDRIANFLVDKLGIFKSTSGSALRSPPRGRDQQPGNEKARGSDTPHRNQPNARPMYTPNTREIRYPRRIPRRKCVLMSCQHGSKNIHPSARGGFRC